MGTPRATYRLQLGPDFDLGRAAELVPYLADLGVSHVYTSPITEAEPGSRHGYDVVDHNRVRGELGGESALRSFWQVLAHHGMGHVLDVVPNHMSIAGTGNAWWWEVLAHGPGCHRAGTFDIDWAPPDAASRDKVVLPFLDRPLDEAIEAGVLVVDRDHPRGPIVRHGERVWPLRVDAPIDGRLEDVLAAQHYRLVHWRERDRLLNYRRFFDIDTLVAVRVDEPEVFADVHGLLGRWMRDPLASAVVQGVRVDHVDGIADPAAYLEQLRALVGDRWLVVEKILSAGESLPPWPVDGTTGYDAAAAITTLVVDPRARRPLVDLARALDPSMPDWPTCVAEAKREHLEGPLRPELERAVRALDADGSPAAHREVAERALALGVYRLYGEPGDDPRFAARFAQLTAPLTAKAVEDTALYRWLPLLALNDVGTDPEAFGDDGDALHEAMRRASAEWPRSMVALSTHDSKRSADVRARLAVLSEQPQHWRATVEAWRAHNRRHHQDGESGVGPHDRPDPTTEYHLYQALVGTWPIAPDRLAAYLRKAAREAKVHTTWTDPDPAYETALERFVHALLDDTEFTDSVERFVAPVARAGRRAALTQVTLQLTWPGVPDLYQGDELWNLALVDPDNRRPVDFPLRRRLLDDARSIGLAELWGDIARWGDDEDGLVKIALVHHLLRLRAEQPDLFGPGLVHRAVAVRGAAARHLFAFVRGDRLAVVVPRLVLGLEGDRADATVELPRRPWRDVLADRAHDGGPTPASELLGDAPVAVLTARD